jgi:hypothetical protein
MNLTGAAYDEITAKVIDVLDLSSGIVVTKATKFVRFDWKDLLASYEANPLEGMQPPWCIMRLMPSQEEEWGMANHCYVLPIEIFYITPEYLNTNTTVTTGATSTTQTVGSTSGMFVGQRLYFITANVSRIISSITDGTHVVLTASVTTTTGETVMSDITDDIERKMEILRDTFRAGEQFTNFQLPYDSQMDVSDTNDVNIDMEHPNYTLIGASVFIRPMVGYYDG